MTDNKTKTELNEEELSNISAGKSVITIMEDLLPLASQHPEIIEMMEVLKKEDFGALMMLLQKFKMAHPELAYIFED